MIALYVCVLILACCSILNKHAISGMSPYAIQLINVVVSISLAPIWFWLAKKTQPETMFNKNVIPYVVIAGVLSTIGFILLLTGLKKHSASLATSILSTYPAVALLISAAIGLERLTINKLLGISFILVGIIITVYFNEQ